MTRFLAFLLAVAAAAYGGYALLPAPTFTPALVQLTACEPRVTAGYILIHPDGDEIYVGGMKDLSPADKYMVNQLKQKGLMRLGTLHLAGGSACPGI